MMVKMNSRTIPSPSTTWTAYWERIARAVEAMRMSPLRPVIVDLRSDMETKEMPSRW